MPPHVSLGPRVAETGAGPPVRLRPDRAAQPQQLLSVSGLQFSVSETTRIQKILDDT
jgi:hypothetical protein